MKMKIIFSIINLIFLFQTFLWWREVRGLRGGFGKGVWDEGSWYLVEAKDARKVWTVCLILFTTLHVLAYVNGEL